MRQLTYIIQPQDAGKTIQQYLRGRQGYSYRLLVKLKQYPDGILQNGVHARTIDRLQAGDELAICVRDLAEPVEPSALTVPVLYEDTDVVVFDKPANMPCHQAKNHMQDTLANVFAARYGQQAATFRVLNRLDKDTTGAVLVCKNRWAAAQLTGKVEKSYVAIVCGQMEQDSGVVEQPIARLSTEPPSGWCAATASMPAPSIKLSQK